MGHGIQAIVASSEVAERLRSRYPQIPRVEAQQGFAIIPVDADFIDSATEARPWRSTTAFMRLTDSFHDLLRELSRLGPLAYIETEYFGGVGGQGAAVYSGGEVIMEPEWQESRSINRALGRIGVRRHRVTIGVIMPRPINRALRRLGVRRRPVRDRFATLGLEAYRSNDDLRDAATDGCPPAAPGGSSGRP